MEGLTLDNTSIGWPTSNLFPPKILESLATGNKTQTHEPVLVECNSKQMNALMSFIAQP